MNWSSEALCKPPKNTEMSLPYSADSSPARRLSVNHFAAAFLACWISYGQAAETWPLVVTADQGGQCPKALSIGRQQERKEGLAASFSMLNWNVEKARHPGLVTEFAAYAERSHLIFLQEAVPLKKTETVMAQSLYEAFARGYVQDEIDTGVLTVNLHAVNVSFGVKEYRSQLEAAAELIRAHEGPVIFGGDLNTWSDRRQATLDALTDELGLTAVPFSPDHRTSRFGRPLDHLYVRGLTWQSSETVQVVTSDHNPLLVTLQRLGS